MMKWENRSSTGNIGQHLKQTYRSTKSDLSAVLDWRGRHTERVLGRESLAELSKKKGDMTSTAPVLRAGSGVRPCGSLKLQASFPHLQAIGNKTPYFDDLGGLSFEIGTRPADGAKPPRSVALNPVIEVSPLEYSQQSMSSVSALSSETSRERVKLTVGAPVGLLSHNSKGEKEISKSRCGTCFLSPSDLVAPLRTRKQKLSSPIADCYVTSNSPMADSTLQSAPPLPLKDFQARMRADWRRIESLLEERQITAVMRYHARLHNATKSLDHASIWKALTDLSKLEASAEDGEEHRRMHARISVVQGGPDGSIEQYWQATSWLNAVWKRRADTARRLWNLCVEMDAVRKKGDADAYLKMRGDELVQMVKGLPAFGAVGLIMWAAANVMLDANVENWKPTSITDLK